jgi:hypothetical protein
MNFEKNEISGAEQLESIDGQFIELAECELLFVGGGSGDVVVC